QCSEQSTGSASCQTPTAGQRSPLILPRVTFRLSRLDQTIVSAACSYFPWRKTLSKFTWCFCLNVTDHENVAAADECVHHIRLRRVRAGAADPSSAGQRDQS